MRPAQTLRARAALIALILLAGIVRADVADDTSRHAPAPARRIIALAPHLAELTYAAGAGPRLVGAVRGSDYPPDIARVPVVGDAAGLDLERIFALRPDLVLAWRSGNRPSDIERLEASGVKVFVREPRRLADVAASLRKLGALAGTAAVAEQAAHDFEARLARLRVAGKEPIDVFVEIWEHPLMTVNGSHLISDVMSTCGGRNVFAGLPSLAASVSIEAVLAADPVVIIAASPPGSDPAAQWSRFPRLRAVRAGRVFAIDPDVLARATPRILLGVEKVCGWLREVKR